PDEREAALLVACGDDQGLVREVRRLLEAGDRTGDFLARPVIDSAAFRRAAGVEGLPQSIGRYTVVGLIGQGGMGVVYRATQESPRRTVAVKVVRAGMISAALLRRFEHEVESLGRLDHPGIASIYEAGM